MNIYLNNDTYHKLERYLKNNKISRSQLVSQALDLYFNKEQVDAWPQGLFEFNQEEKNQYPNVEELRHHLLPPKECDLS
jgi:hypothetical protein